MNPKRVKSILGAAVFLFSFSICLPLCAQTSSAKPSSKSSAASATLSGTVTDSSGAPVAHAQISVNNVFSGQVVQTESDSGGNYKVPNLAPGEYEVSVKAKGFSSTLMRVKLKAGIMQAPPVVLSATASSPAGSAAGSSTEPSLSSLGFPTSETKPNPREQALLNKRSHMLQIHQKLGMVTLAAMIAAIAVSHNAKGRHGLPGSPSGRNLHAALGATTAGLYAATAYFALAAPKVHGIKPRGAIRLHRAMAWIHGPGMILTVILGAMAYSQENNGERVHGIAKYHSDAALVTAAALGVAFISVAVK